MESMMTATATAATASATEHSMSGMNMGEGCKISMLWNWNTVGACMPSFFLGGGSLSAFFSPNFFNKRKTEKKERKRKEKKKSVLTPRSTWSYTLGGRGTQGGKGLVDGNWLTSYFCMQVSSPPNGASPPNPCLQVLASASSYSSCLSSSSVG